MYMKLHRRVLLSVKKSKSNIFAKKMKTNKRFTKDSNYNFRVKKHPPKVRKFKPKRLGTICHNPS